MYHLKYSLCQDGLWIIQAESDIEKIMYEKGHVPLPPYINRQDTQQDKTEPLSSDAVSNARTLVEPTAVSFLPLDFNKLILSAASSDI